MLIYTHWYDVTTLARSDELGGSQRQFMLNQSSISEGVVLLCVCDLFQEDRNTLTHVEHVHLFVFLVVDL